MTTKRCSRCGRDLEVSDENFYRVSKGSQKEGKPVRYVAECKPCVIERTKAYSKNATPEQREARKSRSRSRYRDDPQAYKAHQLKHFYGLTLEQFRDMEQAQGGGCAICGSPPTEGRSLAVDHDHRCCPGKRSCGICVRELLCRRCNLGIELFDDNPARLLGAMWYVRKHMARLNEFK